MTTLFRREIEVIVGEPTQPALVIRGLRVQFEVNKTFDKKPNTGRVTVYNLSEFNRSAIREQKDMVWLSAGYVNDVRLLFAGDVMLATHQHQRPDWVTTIEAGDSVAALREQTFSKSYGKDTAASTVVNDIVGAFSASAGKARGLIDTISTRLASGASFAGALRDVMNELESTLNRQFRVSINDGQINVTANASPLAPDAVVLTPETGMVGSPKRLTERKDDGTVRYGVEVTSLLNGLLNPGCVIELWDASVIGTFLVEKVRHNGDTRGAEWYSTVEAYDYP